MGKFTTAIFDVDGTLFDYKEKKIHQTTVDAIKKLQAQGLIIIIASGRSYPLLGTECMEKITANYYVMANGHCVLDKEGRELFSRRFTYEQTELLVRLTQKYKSGLMLKYSTHNCIYSKYAEMFQVFNNIGLDEKKFRFCPNMDYHHQELPLGFTIRGVDEMKQELRERINEFRVELFYDKSECDVFSVDTNKMTALKYLAKTLQLNPEDCIAYGDSCNDIEMIQWAGTGVAMGNACDELKDVADYVCKSSWENGIAASLELFKVV